MDEQDAAPPVVDISTATVRAGGAPLPPPDPARTVGVVGAGTMGAGIAEVALRAGHDVLIYDSDRERVNRAVADIATSTLRRALRTGGGKPEADVLIRRLRGAQTLEDLAPARIVIEAIVESLQAKQELFAALEDVVDADAILATNTSSLSVTAIQRGLDHPGRVVGMHFFNPAQALPLVEVVSGAATDSVAADRVVELASAWGKTPVRAASTPGFIVNRVARPFYGEAFAAYEQGVADPATIDAVLREAAGFAMGPFELTDLIGHDVNSAVSRSVWEAMGYDPRFTPSQAQRDLVDAGRLGRKSGRGWFSYGEDGRPTDRPEPSTAPAAAPPDTVVALDERLAPLVARAAACGVRADAHTTHFTFSYRPLPVPEGSIVYRHPHTNEELRGGIHLRPYGALLRLTDGRTATELTGWTDQHVLVLDVVDDFATASRVALALPDGCPDEITGEAVGLLQTAGLAVSIVDDSPGLIVARTLAMLVNLAADAVHLGVAGAAEVDLAMTKGVRYPHGPLEWGDRLGPGWVVTVLDNLAAAYGDGRHRVSPWLRRRAQAGRGLR